MDDETIRFISLASQCKGNAELERDLAQIVKHNFLQYLVSKKSFAAQSVEKRFKVMLADYPDLLKGYTPSSSEAPGGNLFGLLDWQVVKRGIIWYYLQAKKPTAKYEEIQRLIYDYIYKFLKENKHTYTNQYKTVYNRSYYYHEDLIFEERV